MSRVAAADLGALLRAAPAAPPTPLQPEHELRLYDAPGLLDALFVDGKEGDAAGDEHGAPCRVAAADGSALAAEAFRGDNSSGYGVVVFPEGPSLAHARRRARAHADAGARVALAVPLRRNAGGVPLLSALAADGDAVVRARPAEIEGLRIALHGLGGGGAAAVQAALALGADAAALVLEGVPSAVRDLPGVGGLFGCCAGEPLPIQHRLGGVRCPVGVVASGPGPLDASTARAHATRILAAVTNARAKTALEPGPEVSAFISRFAVS